MREAGFAVEARASAQINRIRARLGARRTRLLPCG